MKGLQTFDACAAAVLRDHNYITEAVRYPLPYIKCVVDYLPQYTIYIIYVYCIACGMFYIIVSVYPVQVKNLYMHTRYGRVNIQITCRKHCLHVHMD